MDANYLPMKGSNGFACQEIQPRTADVLFTLEDCGQVDIAAPVAQQGIDPGEQGPGACSIIGQHIVADALGATGALWVAGKCIPINPRLHLTKPFTHHQAGAVEQPTKAALAEIVKMVGVAIAGRGNGGGRDNAAVLVEQARQTGDKVFVVRQVLDGFQADNRTVATFTEAQGIGADVSQVAC